MSEITANKSSKSGIAIWGATALFAASVGAVLADLEAIPDGGLLAGKENVYVAEEVQFTHNGLSEEANIIFARPLDQDGKPAWRAYFNETGGNLKPGMYRLTTRANFFRLLDMGPAIAVKADLLI